MTYKDPNTLFQSAEGHPKGLLRASTESIERDQLINSSPMMNRLERATVKQTLSAAISQLHEIESRVSMLHRSIKSSEHINECGPTSNTKGGAPSLRDLCDAYWEADDHIASNIRGMLVELEQEIG